MNALDCKCVSAWVNKAASVVPPDALQLLEYPALPPCVRIVACCSEVNNAIPRPILFSIGDVVVSSTPVHGIAIQCRSKIERVVAVGGSNRTGQIKFLDEEGNRTDKFEMEGETINLGHVIGSARCGELTVPISHPIHATGFDEYILGTVLIYEATQRNSTWGATHQANYEIQVKS